MEYNQDLCKEKHDNIEDTLKDHEIRISKNEGDISELKVDNSSLVTKVGDLCDNMKDLTGAIKWGIGIMIPIFLTLLGLLLK